MGSSGGSRPSGRPPQNSRPGGSSYRPRPGSSGPSFGTAFGAGYVAGSNSAYRKGSGRTPYPPSPKKRRGSGGGSGGSGRSGGLAIILIIAVIILVIFVAMSMTSGTSGGIPNSTKNREKLSGNASFEKDCVVDSLGWLNDSTQAGKDLKPFYDQTGVQPYVVFLEYDESLTSDEKKDKYAEKWYSKNIEDENTFVFMYFGTDHEGTGEPGYMCYVMGSRVNSVMDSEAVEIFWACIDKNWYDGDLSENQVIVNAFSETAERIMTKDTTMADVLKWVVIAIIVLGGLILVIRIMKTKRKHEAEKAAETEQILNTPLETSRDELLDKYLNDDKK